MTPKQEAFCAAYIETGNASEAYRQAYCASQMKAETIHVKASELLDNGEVTVRLAELRAGHAVRNAVTVDTLLVELNEARQAAMQADPPMCGAAVSAIMAKAKLLGLDKQQIEVSTKPGAPFFAELVFVRPDPISDA
jgi:phage terminase small subunit